MVFVFVITDDIDATKKAYQRSKQRAHDLDKFMIEANMRIPAVMAEISRLDQADIDRGWAEAFRHEFESLSYQVTKKLLLWNGYAVPC
jgi:hypothetical protein